MPIVLYRVDERLIHGQVVVGWGSPLKADRMVVVDDELAGSEWEQELYCLGVPPEVEASFVTVQRARQMHREWTGSNQRTILLFRSIDAVRGLAEQELLRGVEVNLGGMHHAPGRRKVLAYLYLSPDEEDQLKRMVSAGVSVSAQDLPSSRAIPLDQLPHA
jgi:mannose/fructose/N-acetylgalactosamine-specific phosphotransferase system component IIB